MGLLSIAVNSITDTFTRNSPDVLWEFNQTPVRNQTADIFVTAGVSGISGGEVSPAQNADFIRFSVSVALTLYSKPTISYNDIIEKIDEIVMIPPVINSYHITNISVSDTVNNEKYGRNVTKAVVTIDVMYNNAGGI